MNRKFALWLLGLGLGLALLSAPALAQDSGLTLKVVQGQKIYHLGQSYPLSFAVNIKPGLHINGPRPEDPNMIPTKLTLKAQPGLSFAALRYPPTVRRKFSFSKTPIAVYEGEVIIRTTLKVARQISPGLHAVHAELSFQSCDKESCYLPETVKIVFQVRVVN